MTTVDANVWIAAYDPIEVHHITSVEFLREATRRDIVIYCPAFVLVEVASSVVRRSRNTAAGELAADRIASNPLVQMDAPDEPLLSLARQFGTRQFLRGADALYAATAQVTGTMLVSWDNELIERAGAISPTTWLDAYP